MSEPTDLSGYWSGWYAYTGWTERVPFTAWLTMTGDRFTGTTLESNSFALASVSELTATLSGSVNEMRVSFEKVYDRNPGVHALPVRYEGVLDNDYQVISGHWVIHNNNDYVTGDFEMSRLMSTALAENEVSEVKVLQPGSFDTDL